MWFNISSHTTLNLMMQFCALLIPYHVMAQVEVAVEADTNSILIGEQIELQLSATFPDSFSIEFPAYFDKIDDFEIIKQKDAAPESKNQFTTLRRSYHITSFDTGYFVIKPIPFLVQHSGNDSADSLFSEPLLIRVSTIAIDSTAELKPIKGPMAVKRSFWEWAPYLFVPLLLILLGGLVWYLLMSRKQAEEEAVEAAPVIPPHIWALNKLEDLEQKKLWEQGRIKRFHSELTNIIREYIERSFRVPALESTTDEILIKFRRIPVSRIQVENLRAILEKADMVKFARMKPDPESNQQSFDAAVRFVKETSEEEEMR